MSTIKEEHGAVTALPTIPKLPRAPSPSADKGLAADVQSADTETGDLPDAENINIFTLAPVSAMKMLCEALLLLVRVTGDVPPTPPISAPSTPDPGLIQSEKESLSRNAKGIRRRSDTTWEADDDDAVPARAKTPIGSPEAHPSEALKIIGTRMQPLNIQHGAITRKFYSKKQPPIALEDYLTRLHKYCPMSTAVYLATSLYIHRLAVIERILSVTGRNVHRLVLAGLRVASKALDDLCHAHTRFAKVGGVTERELGRLEVSFCFVTNFELKVDEKMLLSHAKLIRGGKNLFVLHASFQPKLPPVIANRALMMAQTKANSLASSDAPAVA